MKISIDDQHLFTLSETQKKVIKNDVLEEIFEEDMKRRVHYILTHKYEECFKRLKNEWDQKLIENGISMAPTNPESYAELVFSQPNYKNRSQRDKG